MSCEIGDTVIAFNAREWEEAGYDQPEGNDRFFQKAEILDLSFTKKYHERIATLKWPDGRISFGHFVDMVKGES